MPFHEIPEVTFTDRFNGVWNRRHKDEEERRARRRLVRRRSAAKTPDPDKEIDIWA